MMYTYKNSFHNTEFKSRKSPEELENIEHSLALGHGTDAQRAFHRRMKEALCGNMVCTCGDFFGRRG